LKYKKEFLHFSNGRRQINNWEQGKTEKFIPLLQSPLVKMTGAVSFIPP
jgi:hypothetical protein